jgi:hypothetical protein
MLDNGMKFASALGRTLTTGTRRSIRRAAAHAPRRTRRRPLRDLGAATIAGVIAGLVVIALLNSRR